MLSIYGHSTVHMYTSCHLNKVDVTKHDICLTEPKYILK